MGISFVSLLSITLKYQPHVKNELTLGSQLVKSWIGFDIA